jgi:hypothetical protein
MMFIDKEAVVMRCEIKLIDGSDKVSIEIPIELPEAIGCAPGQALYAYAIGSEGIWLSPGECPQASEFLVALNELQKATKDAHAAVKGALGMT